jgi:hypothetical protein
MDGLRFAPGAADAVLGMPDGKAARLLRRVVARVRSGMLDDPDELESVVRGVPRKTTLNAFAKHAAASPPIRARPTRTKSAAARTVP